MVNYWIDTHAHIYSGEFDGEIEDMMSRSVEKNVGRIYMPNIDSRSIEKMLEVESRWPDICIPMMGLHPTSVKDDFEQELYIVEEWLGKRKFAAVGEMGTDLYWDKTFFEQQKEAFRIQAGLARRYALPLVIHCRESIDETIALVEAIQDGTLTGIFHCFTGTIEQAEKIIQQNFYLGIGGVATFKNGGLDKVLPKIPPDRIVFETDSPYLAPVPHRGKRNEPSYIPLIAAKVSEIMGLTIEQVQNQTTQNALRLFSKKSLSL